MTNEEYISEICGKDVNKGYQTFVEMKTLSNDSDQFYALFDTFLKMLDNDRPFMRTRGFCLICAQAKWDKNGLIKKNLNKILDEIDEEEPTGVRQCLFALPQVVKALPELSGRIADNLKAIDTNLFHDSMKPLIEKDIANVLKVIDGLGKQN